jgi:hypothetical protein
MFYLADEEEREQYFRNLQEMRMELASPELSECKLFESILNSYVFYSTNPAL